MNNKLIKGNVDFFFGIVCILFGIGGYILSSATISKADAAVMPEFLFAFCAVCGLGMSISSVLRRKREEEDLVHISWKETWFGIVLPGAFLIAAYFAISTLGFFVAEFLLILALMILQNQISEEKTSNSFKNIIGILVFATATVIVMYIIFHVLFALPTPKGIFGF